MSAHKVLNDLFKAEPGRDPGASGTINVNQSPVYFPLVSAAAETRTLARPTRTGAVCTLHMKTDGGDITLTVTGGYNEAGDTTFTFSDPGQFITFISCYDGTNYYWRMVASHQTASLSALTATAAELNYLDADGGLSQLTTGAGVGITSGTGTVYKTSVMKFGSIIYTIIYIDLTGLASIATDGDIIGVNGGGAAHIGRITAAVNGTIESMKVFCTETPAGGLADIDIFRATVGTGVQDDAISGLTGQATTGVTNITATATIKCATAVPAANDYLYLCAGAGSGAGTYTAGKLEIHLIGY